MSDTVFGSVIGVAVATFVFIVSMIIYTNGERNIKAECDKFGKAEVWGKVWECSFKEVKP